MTEVTYVSRISPSVSATGLASRFLLRKTPCLVSFRPNSNRCSSAQACSAGLLELRPRPCLRANADRRARPHPGPGPGAARTRTARGAGDRQLELPERGAPRQSRQRRAIGGGVSELGRLRRDRRDRPDPERHDQGRAGLLRQDRRARTEHGGDDLLRRPRRAGRGRELPDPGRRQGRHALRPRQQFAAPGRPDGDAGTIPSRLRIVMLDSCRNNPFPNIDDGRPDLRSSTRRSARSSATRPRRARKRSTAATATARTRRRSSRSRASRTCRSSNCSSASASR